MLKLSFAGIVLTFAARRRHGLLAASIIAVASLALAGCGGGHGLTRASNQPTALASSSLGKVAYVLDGSIYVESLPEGESVRIAEGTSPRWSPSGDWLLYWFGGSEGSYVMRADGSDKRPLLGDKAVWSPTEDRVAEYQGPTGRNPSTSLLVESADGSIRQEAWLIATPTSGPVWSPDGKRLAYSQEGAVPCSMAPTGGNGNPMRRSSLCVVNADNAQMPRIWPIDLYDSTSNGLIVAGWTADSQYVLFWTDPEFANSAMNDGLPLYSIPASGGQPRKLTFSLLSGTWQPSPSGGATILMTEGLSRFQWTAQRLALADAAAGEVSYLTGEDTASQQPDWSPDGRSIVFVSQPDKGMGPGGSGTELEKLASDRRIWVMDSDGGDQRPLTDDPAYRDEAPLWSADGSRILFARMDDQRFASLWLMNADGSDLRQVVERIGSSSEGLLGYYTNIGWPGRFDWWEPPTSTQTTPEPAAEATKTPASPTVRHTGIEGVDAVIDAVLSGDPETLRPFVKFTNIACTTSELGLGGPPLCRPDEADGTIVEAFPVAHCEGYYVRPDKMEALLRSLTGGNASVYAVYLSTADSWPVGDYVAVLAVDAPDLGVVAEELYISGGRLVGAHQSCGKESPEQVVQERPFARVVLPPP